MAERKFKIREIRTSSWDRARLKSLLEACAAKRVLVVGDVGIDRYTIGTVERISPEAPVPIVFVQEEQLKLGLAANVADNIQVLGGDPWLVGLVGDDRPAHDFKRLLQRCEIRSSHLVTDPSRRTVLKERVVSERQQLLRVDYESTHPIDRSVEQAILKKVRQLLPRVDAVILQDYAKGMLTTDLAEALFASARKAGRFVAVDPNAKTPVTMYRGATVLTPNIKEAEKLSGMAITDEASLVQAGLAILKATAAPHLVITRGKDGMAIFNAKTREVCLIPTYVREVYDVSGAGDTVIAVLTLALSAGASMEEAAILGNLAAGVEVGKRGTATVTPDEVMAALEFFGAIGV